MTDIPPNFAAVKQGLIPLTPQERAKLEKDGLDVIHDIYRYAKTGFETIDPGGFRPHEMVWRLSAKAEGIGLFL